MTTIFDPIKYGATKATQEIQEIQPSLPKFSSNAITPTKKEDELLTSWGSLAWRNITSMPRSTYDFAKNIVKALNPLTTIKALQGAGEQLGYAREEMGSWGKVAKEGVKSALGIGTYESPLKGVIPKSIWQMSEGKLTEAANTIANDPVGQIGPPLLLAKYAFDKAGMGAQFDKAMQIIAKPVTVPAKFIGQKIVGAIGAIGANTLGVTTGVGKGAIKEAYQGSPEFKAGLKGQTTAENVVDMAKNAIETIKENRRTEYVSQLKKMPQTGNITLDPIIETLNKQLSRFRIGVTEDGKLDFSSSALRNDTAAINDITTIFEDVTNWKDVSPKGIDALKQGIKDLYSPTTRSSAFVESMQKVVGDTLKQKVPEYTKLMKNYEEASDLLSDLKGLSLGGKANPDTIFSKLTTALKGNNEMKNALLAELEAQGQKNISGAIAGVKMKPSVSGVVRTSLAGGVASIGGFQPSDLLIMASTSPRIIAEFVGVLGLTATKTSSFLKMLDTMRDFYGIGIPKIQQK